MRSDAAQFVVNEREQFGCCRTIPFANTLKDLGQIAHVGQAEHTLEKTGAQALA